MKRLPGIGFALLLWVGVAWGGGPVWQVSGNGTRVFIGGTCHVLRETDLPLPVVFEQAYRLSDRLVFETDLARMAAPETVRHLVRQGQYPEGIRLTDKLTSATGDRLAAHCRQAGIPVAAVTGMRPALVFMTLLSVELQRLGANLPGVDQRLYDRAIVDGKPVEGLETTAEQLAFVLAMGEGNEDRFITHLLKDLQDTRNQLDQLISAWRSADVPVLVRLYVTSLKQEFPGLYNALLVQRNSDWLPKIEAYLASSDTEFILVGVAHLVGSDGLLTRLAQRGYQVSMMTP